MTGLLLVNLLVFLGLAWLVRTQQRAGHSLSRQVLIGLILGVGFGFLLHLVYVDQSEVIAKTLAWTQVVGGGYVSLLKMIVMPLVLVSMLSAVVKLDRSGSLGKISLTTISILLVTTMIAALIGILVSAGFGLSAEGLTQGVREAQQLEQLGVREAAVQNLTLPQMILSFIPTNPFADLTGARSTSIIAVVIFAILLGLAARHVMHEKPELERGIRGAVEIAQSVVMRLVKMVMALTPYGILALMTKVVASSSWTDILNLLSFIVASYVAIALMFVVHGLLVGLVGVNPIQYFKRVWPVLTFAFSSRSSAATIPLNVEAQIDKLNVPPAIANLSASFGATIGQNGCAGIYPAMLAVMVAPSAGINPMDIHFILSLIGVVAISSFGIAGVGGGATFAALIVLPTMGLNIAVVALLISIEPLIDMARTALNVSGSMTAGTLTSRILGSSKDESSEVLPSGQESA
ncbi:L-cystine uptake protein TcyP [Vibrio stylophorae]|uniref:L-cystine uptake protein TcyP n=1 Tax=Vibrio stylophorae TaxID=659351 RepID=A0ABM8ZRD3_9VIBR|nr:L-cystine transporter [Vibrio stylophorae]CAH0532461.1 L-cystine uptake protein TcyP [Vibrio stylophorae]